MSQQSQISPPMKSLTTDAEIDAALEQTRAYEEKYGPSPYAVKIDYINNYHLLVVHLSNGLRLALPVENLQGLENATPEQLGNYELHGPGYGFGFPDLDADFYVDGLIEGVYGNRKWMAELGRRGGASRSEAKRKAVRANGAKGGRPRKDKAPAA